MSGRFIVAGFPLDIGLPSLHENWQYWKLCDAILGQATQCLFTCLQSLGLQCMHISTCACAAWAYIMLRQKAYRVREADQRDRVPLSNCATRTQVP